MRKFLFAAAVIAATLFSSCVKQPALAEEPVPAIEENAARAIEIGACLPSETKATAQEVGNNLKTTWDAGDKISVIYYNGADYVNECFTLSSGEGTTSATFANGSSLLPDSTPFTICYPYREASAEGVWAMLLGSQTGTVDGLGNLDPLMGSASSLDDTPTVTSALTVLRLCEGLKLFTDDTESGAAIGITVSGEHLHATAVFDGTGLTGNKGPVVLSGPLSTTGGCLDQNVYVALHLTDEGRTDTSLDIRVQRGDNTYNWTLSRSGKTMENGQMYSVRPSSGGTHPALPPQKLKTVEPTAENELYVATDGNDANPGTLASPLLTLQRAFNLCSAGTHIYLRGGTYNASAWLYKSGTEENPIVVSSYGSETAILDGTGLPDPKNLGNDYPLVALVGPSNKGAHWITFRNLTFQHSRRIGLGIIYASSHITVNDCRFLECPGPGIGVGFCGNESQDIRIFNNYLENCAQTSREAISIRKVNGFDVYGNHLKNITKEAIDAKNGCQNGVIRNNIVENSGHVGVYVDAGYTTEPSGMDTAGQSVPVTRNILIYGNKIVFGTYKGTGITVASEQGNSARDIYIYNNLVYNVSALPATTQSAGIKVAKNSDDGIHTGLLKDIYIYNNTVYNHAQQGIYVNYPTIENIVIRNNISAYNQAGDIQINSECDESQVTIQNNLFYNATGATTHPGYPYYNITDPSKVFVKYWDADWTQIDLRIPAGGAAIDKGTFLTAPSTDYAGTERPQGLTVDIGAYEYN